MFVRVVYESETAAVSLGFASFRFVSHPLIWRTLEMGSFWGEDCLEPNGSRIKVLYTNPESAITVAVPEPRMLYGY
jgi:hypothetical protein